MVCSLCVYPCTRGVWVSLIWRIFVAECAQIFDSRELSGHVQSLACNGNLSMWLPCTIMLNLAFKGECSCSVLPSLRYTVSCVYFCWYVTAHLMGTMFHVLTSGNILDPIWWLPCFLCLLWIMYYSSSDSYNVAHVYRDNLKVFYMETFWR